MYNFSKSPLKLSRIFLLESYTHSMGLFNPRPQPVTLHPIIMGEGSELSYSSLAINLPEIKP